MVSVVYADTSALVRAYFVDETDHASLREQLLEGSDGVVTSAVAAIEFTSAVRAAARAGRITMPDELLARFKADCGDSGPLALIRLDADPVLAQAGRLVNDHALRTLDAIHLAVAIVELPLLTERPCLVTRDEAQAAAALREGFALA